MKIVVDTNVLVSGIFFSGPPYEILKAWRDGKTYLVISTEILKEYQRVADELARQFPGVDVSEIMDLLMVEAEIAHASPLPKPVCSDPKTTSSWRAQWLVPPSTLSLETSSC